MPQSGSLVFTCTLPGVGGFTTRLSKRSTRLLFWGALPQPSIILRVAKSGVLLGKVLYPTTRKSYAPSLKWFAVWIYAIRSGLLTQARPNGDPQLLGGLVLTS